MGRVTIVLSWLLVGLAATTTDVKAQSLRVIDDVGQPVPYAVVSIAGAAERVVDQNGRLTQERFNASTVEIRARRIGYREYRGFASSDSLGLFVRMQRIAVQLETVVSTAIENTPLARTGFYDRLQRVQRGAIVGEFMTPEQLDDRHASLASNLLVGQRYVRLGRMTINGRTVPVLLGRGGCGMTVLLDGSRVNNMVEESVVGEAPTSINGRGTTNQLPNPMSLDQIVDGNTIMAIEIYPSTANAPAELQSLGGRGSCGIIAIWTGPRK